jgi:DNA-binding transcriptional regulator YdaS (Cro superfamily)
MATPLQRALAAPPFEGNQSKFAAAIGTKQQNISNWVRKGSKLPAELVPKASEVTGIPAHEWRPDVFAPVPAQPSHREPGVVAPASPSLASAADI